MSGSTSSISSSDSQSRLTSTTRASYRSPHFYIGAVLVIYLLATCVSGLFSSHRCVNVFGVLAFVLAVVAYQVSAATFVSVWCFSASPPDD